ncbi:armadillo-type protein [Gilbertella persicaria]|uniref:V-type proton ATPase subunit H n=1 Tax=Rhizopus stolonifer TaxID=4846 RepID=A0A367KJU8_RHIST|nr:armadillo-type protein [Gilbertella persicaria]KAI8064318.1 armadillo-type protein [Gilbertella persicaria]RCI02505.1 H(+)-transporting V1 sector ATPase subunit H [Rhizopus stolonifer]
MLAVDDSDVLVQTSVLVDSEAQVFARNELIEEIRTTIISHPYLDDMLNKIRDTAIPWEDYKNVGLITADEVAMIQHVENKTTKELVPIMTEHGLYYAALYLELMQKLARVDALQKVLVLIHDMLNEHEERIELFHQAGEKVVDFPFGPFHKALRIGDEFIGIQSSKVLTLLICSTSQRDIDIYEFFRWITFQLQSQHQHVVDLNIQILDALFHIPEYRKAFWNTTHAIDSLANILKKAKEKNVGPQKIYEITFAIWLLTFDKDIAKNLDKKCQVIPTLVDLAKFAVKEKVIRVVIATFKNLIEKAVAENMSAMLVAKLLPLCDHLATRKWNDQEITDDVVFVQTKLQQNFQSLTTFEVYASELETGMLQWSPSHSSENFWKQNATRLNENSQLLLRQLTRLLSSSTDPVVLAVACHDIGQYVKYNSIDGKKHLEALGAKQRVMELMTHQDSDVRYQALCATQKYFAMTS